MHSQEHSCTMNMEQYLTNQMEQLREENQQLKAALRQAELRLSIMEKEKACQQAALSEKVCDVDQLTSEKQQMSAELEVRRVQLTQLKEGQQTLKELFRSKTCEMEKLNLKLKTKLKTVRAELDQANSSLRTLEGADGQGLKVALGMQKQITAKREQIDFMQSRIQQLEESIEKLKMEKHRQALLVKKHTQDLMSERESRRRLESEVKTLCLKERELKGKEERLEAALYKMSESFAECQDFVQKQEQEIMRLKLQHALDIKEMQSQNWRNISRSPISSHTLQTHLPLAQHIVNGLMEIKVCDPIAELPGGIAKEQRPHTITSSRRRPEEDHHQSRQPAESKDADCTTRPVRRITSHRTAQPYKQDPNSPLSANTNFGVDQMYKSLCSGAAGRMSPVHLLLCPLTETTANTALRTASNQDELTGLPSQKSKLSRE